MYLAATHNHIRLCNMTCLSIIDLWPWCWDLDIGKFMQINSQIVWMPALLKKYILLYTTWKLWNIVSLSIFVYWNIYILMMHLWIYNSYTSNQGEALRPTIFFSQTCEFIHFTKMFMNRWRVIMQKSWMPSVTLKHISVSMRNAF